jgi:2'-5' RNA ligase
MRLFVAVPVPEEIRAGASGLAREIAQEGVVPVRPGNMHLTLKFIGETDERDVDAIKEKLRKVRFRRFSCTMKGVGVFPNEDYVRVVWAGCESNGALEALAEGVMGALSGHGADERFTAHLTIARVKRKAALGEFIQNHKNDEFGSFEVVEFRLISSVLGPAGPRYTVIGAFMAEDGDA